ncbi:MAG: hypothetical protein LBH34_06400 [Prevotellaceae bacterium]|jgi:hypothetical protein|nr:hypothetical protein [Prevotellaceae bacterium]
MRLKMTLWDAILIATLVDNPATRYFISLLPLMVNLDDYSNSEKIFYPSKNFQPKMLFGINVTSGDIAYYSTWGNIAIFHKDFGYSTGLVKVGRIESNFDVLKKSSSINNVKFELQGD